MSTKRVRGFPRVFSPEQNGALRAGLRELHTKRRCSQQALGDTLGVVQQAVGRLLKSDDAGFSYDTATRLVRALNYSSVDTFFRAKGVTTPDSSTQVTKAHARAS